MADWIVPVFDRTQDDVIYAISKIAEWKENNITNTSRLKGCLNDTDINRIENNIQYISDRLSSLYYFTKIEAKTWDMSQLPDITDVNRIIGNLNNIISSYFKPNNSPDVPTTMLTYEQINHIEQNLSLLKEMIDNMVNSFRECGTFNCGEG